MRRRLVLPKHFPATAGRQCENLGARALAGIIRLRAATAGQADPGYNRSLITFHWSPAFARSLASLQLSTISLSRLRARRWCRSRPRCWS